MTVASLSPLLVQKFFDNNGAPLAGGKLYTYQAGTNTPVPTYTNSTGSTANTNPLVLNARGECNVWVLPNTGYKFVLQDSLSNTIYTVDQVFNGVLTTLFGGVDTGIANAYVLNYAAPYASLSNGIIVYFVAANTNTGASTLNVNSLGVVPILNQNGNPLSPGQIVQGGITAVLYYNGNWLLTSSTGSVPQSGSFSATVQGGSQAPLTCTYSVSGQNVNINLPYCAFTSTATTFSLTGLPTALQPATTKVVPIAVMQNNGAYITNANAFLNSSNVITFNVAASSGGWTATGVKGIGYLSGPTQIGVTLAYNLL